jgi:hypothetical protein
MELEETPDVDAWAGMGFLLGMKLSDTRHQNESTDKRPGAAGRAI